MYYTCWKNFSIKKKLRIHVPEPGTILIWFPIHCTCGGLGVPVDPPFLPAHVPVTTLFSVNSVCRTVIVEPSSIATSPASHINA